jgi:hypothetical protein
MLLFTNPPVTTREVFNGVTVCLLNRATPCVGNVVANGVAICVASAFTADTALAASVGTDVGTDLEANGPTFRAAMIPTANTVKTTITIPIVIVGEKTKALPNLNFIYLLKYITFINNNK